MSITATNIDNTSQNTCSCGSWLKHWEKFSGSKATYCAEVKCTSSPEVGAHVQKGSASDWYIIPLCKAHNNKKGESLEVVDSTKFVSANVSETCGKK